ncbi:hypothetical protein [Halococcus thailandensis]|uniref:hypothetical protein n=1 Tax=Halococcus thailandensis TaxID=335952 RepID=UPI000A6B8E7E|nr:hypothetical protein [Halococcus thailandensis]
MRLVTSARPPIDVEPALTVPEVTFQMFMLTVFFTIVMLYVLAVLYHSSRWA